MSLAFLRCLLRSDIRIFANPMIYLPLLFFGNRESAEKRKPVDADSCGFFVAAVF